MDDYEQRKQDLHDVIPRNCGDILALVEKAIERYWNEPTILNLYPMVLLTSHVADWYVHADLGHDRDCKFVEEFGGAYPKWSAVRDVGNGLKHSTIAAVSTEQFHSEDMAWEHRDFWDGIAYGADFEGRKVPIDALCFDFIKEFSGDRASGRLKDLLPRLHKG